MKTTIDCTRSLHNLYSRLRFLGFTLSTYSHIMQVFKLRFMKKDILPSSFHYLRLTRQLVRLFPFLRKALFHFASIL